MDSVIVEYVGPVQTLSASALPEHRERVAALLPLCHYGPSYVRGVAEDLGRYRWAYRLEPVGYWIERRAWPLIKVGRKLAKRFSN